MKRSSQVAAPLLALAAAAMLSGCRKPEMQRCVDENNKVVDDSLCGSPHQQMRPDGHGGFIPILIPYHFYYGGYGGYGLGSIVGGGSFTPSPRATYSTRSGITTRGGFGSSFSSEGSHGGGTGE